MLSLFEKFEKMGKIVHNNYITIAKAIGIILMVVGHSGCPDVVYRFIYLFHMPLFFFCSGFFMKDMTDNESIMLFVKRRVIGLYIPFVKWSILFLLFHNLLLSLGVYNSFYGYEGGASYYTMKDVAVKVFCIVFTMHGYEELLGGFWFIRALFVSSILISVILCMMRGINAYKYEIMCLLFLSVTVLIRRIAPESDLWHDLSMGAFGAFFYMMGCIAKRNSHIWKNKYGVVYCFFLLASYCYFKREVSMECGYNKVLPFSIGAMAGIFFIIYLSNMIDAKFTCIKPVLYYVGNHTLVILALHFLSFRLVSYILSLWYGIDTLHIAEHPVIKDILSINNSWWWALYAFVGIGVPLLLNYAWLEFKKKVR